MTRKRSTYRPKGVNPTAHLMAMMGAARLSTTDALRRAQALHDHVAEICAGRASDADWRGLFDAVNMAEQLISMRVASGREAVNELQQQVIAICDRQRETLTRALYPAEVLALRDFAADYAGLLSGVTQQQYLRAQLRVEDRIRRVLSGERIPASVRVVDALT